MPKATLPTNIAVVWETIPYPDPHALLTAVAMLFGRRVPLSTEVDLTVPDKTLMCEQQQDP